MIKFDYHTHTLNSPDSGALPAEMVESAIRAGLDEIAFTDHIDFTYPRVEVISPYGITEILLAARKAARKYSGLIKVLAGAEFGLRPDVADEAAQIAALYDFDFIIGSLHVNDIQMEGFAKYNFSNLYDKHKAYMIYFEHMLETVKACDSFDVLGHMDYIERYGKYADNTLKYEDFSEIIDEILKVTIGKGKGIEINTSGYARGLGRPHPQPDIVRRFAQLGGEILTVGSDAHTPAAVGYAFGDVYRLLTDLGIKYITKFEEREPIFVKV